MQSLGSCKRLQLPDVTIAPGVTSIGMRTGAKFRFAVSDRLIPTTQDTRHSNTATVPLTVNPVSYLDPIAELLLGAVVGGVSIFLFVRRKFSQDTTGIARDRAEITLLETLIKQAEVYKGDAREAWSQRTRDAEQIARQNAEIAHLKEATAAMQRMLAEVAPDKARYFLSPVQPPPEKDDECNPKT